MTAPRPLRAITFDCWGTLIHEVDAQAGSALRVRLVREVVGAARPELSPGAALEALRQAHHRHVELWLSGVASGSAEIASWTLEALGLPDERLQWRLAGALAEASLAQEVAPLPGAGDTLTEMASAGMRLALVCDTGFSPGRVVRRLLDRAGLLEHLHVLCFSDEVGVPKPHPKPFQAALDSLGVPPHEAIHVGDLRRTDVAGGRELGMHTVRIRDVHDDASELPDADHVVDSHAELLRFLRELMA